MDSTVAAPVGVIKRSRQACSGCRKKKIKCSGERPICMNCQQAQRGCIYEPYSNRPTRNVEMPASSQPQFNATFQANAELLQRISTIESMLTRLSNQASDTLRQRADSVSSSDTTSRPFTQDLDRFQALADCNGSDNIERQALTFDVLPPTRVFSSLIDEYFSRVHNQPYGYFHEASFRERIRNGTLPKSLQFAVLALAVRFSSHTYFRGKTHEASHEYSKQSWYLILSDHLMALTSISLSVIQTISLLAISNYTAGHVNEGWLKVGITARLLQAIDLMDEPSHTLPEAEQQERRITFWSIYILDRLMSCARSRPPAISDNDIYVRLPDPQEETTTTETDRITPTLRPLLSCDAKIASKPQGLTLVILMTSILGQCTKYAHGRAGVDVVPPWDAKSDYTSTNASLMLLESYFDIVKSPFEDSDTAAHDTTQLRHMIFARTLFHLCHCLINHPFLLRIRLRPFVNKVSRRFSLRALQTAEENARQLTDLLTQAAEGGVLIESSFYTYCVAVAGAIHSMACRASFSGDGGGLGQYETDKYFQQSLGTIKRLSHFWPMASNIAARLETFHNLFKTQHGFFEPGLLTSPLEPSLEELLWSVADYNSLAGSFPVTVPANSSASPTFPDHLFNSMSSIPSPPLWDPAIVGATGTEVEMDMQIQGGTGGGGGADGVDFFGGPGGFVFDTDDRRSL